MRNIFYTLAISIALISCSNDNEIIQDKEVVSSSNTAARPSYTQVYVDSIFSEYVNSSIFKSLITERENFVSKVNRIEDFEFLITIESEDQFLLWITSNIAYTNFLSIEDAVSQRKYISELKRTEVQYFPQVYDFIINAPEELVIDTLKEWIGNDRVIGLNNSCEDKLTSCENNAWVDYYLAVNKALQPNNNNPFYSLDKADEDFEWNMRRCAYSYTDCIG